MTPEKLYVVTCISNPLRFKSRERLYRQFAEHMRESGVTLVTAEMTFGERPYQVTELGNPHHVQVRGHTELWHKECLLNLGMQRVVQLYPDAKYLAWIDADVEFVDRRGWAVETIQQLQHYQVVQLFQKCIDMDPQGVGFQQHNGFAWSYATGRPRGRGYGHWHPGFAWAIRRSALDSLGGLYDMAALGSGDHLMAWSFLGQGAKQLEGSGVIKLEGKMSPGYVGSVADWERRAVQYLHRDLGYLPGMILHHWHGKKADRRYESRYTILSKYQFDPYTDLKRDTQGLWVLDMDGTERMINMRDGFRRYFRGRNEDSIDFV